MLLRPIEILSPARNLETGIAAIESGADAVYIGPPKFGARAAAGNNPGDIKKLCEYAHFFNAKVYIAMNTILRDGELEEAQAMAFELHSAGADALIVQDMGLLEIEMPPIPFFASTQTNNVTPDKVKFFEDAGFSRVILARELSLEQIRQIRKAVSIDLEFFIHGSLCVCYSGQCYMSMVSTGRSANRGECSQPCRLPYQLSDKEGNVISSGKHLLSLKDLNLSEHLGELIDAGIDSFKIEGRLKDADHVRNVTAYYRRKLDQIILDSPTLRKASSGIVYCKFDPNPAKTFNRGFTTYMITGERDGLGSFKTPKFVGEPVGKVKKVFSDRVEMEGKTSFLNGDGLSFFNDNGVLTGFNVNKAQGQKLYPHKMPRISVGAEVFRNFDKSFMDKLNSGCERRIIVDFEFYEMPGGFILKAKDEDGYAADVELCIPKELAEKTEAVERGLRDSLSKTGQTSFRMGKLIIDTSAPFLFEPRRSTGCEGMFLKSWQQCGADPIKQSML